MKPAFQSLGRFRLGVGVSFSADSPATGLEILVVVKGSKQVLLSRLLDHGSDFL